MYTQTALLLQKESGSDHGIPLTISFPSIRKMQIQTLFKNMLDAGHQHGKISVD
jgi:hypothetical protein